jgi:hypothetical protein
LRCAISISLNSQLLDKYIAPGISIFTRATIPDLVDRFPQAAHWVENYFINTYFRARDPDDMRQLFVAFFRHAQLAVSAYTDARNLTLEYLDGNDPDYPKINEYYVAIARWEHFTIESSILLATFKHIVNDRNGAFTKGDGSLEDRLTHLANKVKHIGDDIRNKKLYRGTDSIPLWLSDVGLNGADTHVSYAEASQFLEDVAKFANEAQSPPVKSANKTPPAPSN